MGWRLELLVVTGISFWFTKTSCRLKCVTEILFFSLKPLLSYLDIKIWHSAMEIQCCSSVIVLLIFTWPQISALKKLGFDFWKQHKCFTFILHIIWACNCFDKCVSSVITWLYHVRANIHLVKLTLKCLEEHNIASRKDCETVCLFTAKS